MSQIENAVTSSSGTKRAYRKGNPLTVAERQQASLSRKRVHIKRLVFSSWCVQSAIAVLCEAEGVTQAEMIAH
ncbi:replication regulatory protein RepA [Escherichia coli]|uniref:replication regulatory protein RepA n=1 Tax=Escherichia coli TaxID=562 RepID=UPI00050AF339|nr:replication regulatory protein RepA [Escherichia coli]